MNIPHLIGAPIFVMFALFAVREESSSSKVMLFAFLAALGAEIFFL